MFKPGQKVVCVKKSDWSETMCRPIPFALPQKDEIVTVSNVDKFRDGTPAIQLKEYLHYDGLPLLFDCSSFRPLTDSENFADEVLEKLKEGIKQSRVPVLHEI